MSKKRASGLNIGGQQYSTTSSKHAYGLSIPTHKLGFNFSNESFEIVDDIFSLLFERFDAEMMKKRIENEYKTYASKNMLTMVQYVFKASSVNKDKGDAKREDLKPYDYEEESAEPQPPKCDNLGRSLVMQKPKDLKARVHANLSEAKSKKSTKIKLRRVSVRFKGDNRSVMSPDRVSRASSRITKGSIDLMNADLGNRIADTASPTRNRQHSISAFEVRDVTSSLAKVSNYLDQESEERPTTIVTYALPENKGLAEQQAFIDEQNMRL